MALKFRTDSITPLGVPVDPEVYIMLHMSSSGLSSYARFSGYRTQSAAIPSEYADANSGLEYRRAPLRASSMAMTWGISSGFIWRKTLSSV